MYNNMLYFSYYTIVIEIIITWGCKLSSLQLTLFVQEENGEELNVRRREIDSHISIHSHQLSCTRRQDCSSIGPCSSAVRSGTSRSHGVGDWRSRATRHLLGGAAPTTDERRGGGHLLTAGGRWLFTRSAGPPASFASSWSRRLYIASCRPTDWTILTTAPPGPHWPLSTSVHFTFPGGNQLWQRSASCH